MTEFTNKKNWSAGILKRCGQVSLRLLITIVVGCILMFAAFLLPTDPIEANMKPSAEVMKTEAEQYVGGYYFITKWATSQLDNYTDAIMLQEAADKTDDTLLNRALLLYRGIIGSENPDIALIDHYSNGIPYTGALDFSRYWHGNLLLTKLLLSVMNYGTIRILNGIAQFLLLAAICLRLKKRGLQEYIIPYILVYLMLMPVAMAKCISYSICYYIWSAGAFALLSLNEQRMEKKRFFIFLYIGIALAYFDYLTYPIATFGIPALFYLILRRQDTTRKKITDMIGNGFAWDIGYGVMWFGKWAIATLLTGKNVIADGFGQFLYRTAGGKEENWNILNCWFRNYKAFLKTPITILVLAFVLYAIYLFIRRKNKAGKEAIISLIPYGMLFILPAVWYVFALNHSSIHTWFTNKACVVSVSALLFAAAGIIRYIRKEQSLTTNG